MKGPSLQELANDPEVKSKLALIPRTGTNLPPEPYKVRMKELSPRIVDAENSLAGLRARMQLVEHLVNRSTPEHLAAWINRLEDRINNQDRLIQELAAELRNIVDIIAKKEMRKAGTS